jgi:hypothetical protein
MRRILMVAAVALLGFAGSALADGPYVRWSRIEGAQATDGVNTTVGPFFYSGRWRTVSSGHATLNLETGLLAFKFSGVSWALSYGPQPLGGPTMLAGSKLIGTVLCNSSVWADTPVLVNTVDGALAYSGYLNLPAECRTYPKTVVFLIRHPESQGAPYDGTVILYGADRTIRD